jgi:hypothetical protein
MQDALIVNPIYILCRPNIKKKLKILIVTISYSLFQLSRTLLYEIFLSMFIYTFISDTSWAFYCFFLCLYVKLKVEWSEPIIYLSLDTHTSLLDLSDYSTIIFILPKDTNIYRHFYFTNRRCRQELMSTKRKNDYFFSLVWLLFRCEYIYIYMHPMTRCEHTHYTFKDKKC